MDADHATRHPLTKQSEVLAVLRAGGRAEPTGERGLVRLLDAAGNEVAAWQTAIKSAMAKVQA
ncbi:hypothetical protein [Lysobacter olei]